MTRLLSSKPIRTSPSVRLRRANHARRGAAAVEFAMVLPLFLLVVIGAIDVGRAVTVRHTLAEAARAGCRLYAVTEVRTEQDVRDVIQTVMDEASLTGHTIEFDPASTNAIQNLAPVKVSVSIPYDDVGWLSSWFLAGETLVGSCVMPGDTNETDFDNSEVPDPGDDDDECDDDECDDDECDDDECDDDECDDDECDDDECDDD